MKNAPKVVVDTNTLLSGYLFGGKPGLVLQLGIDRKIQLITSSQILAECIDVLKKKFKANDVKVGRFQKLINNVSKFVEPKVSILFVIRDPDDNRVIEAAVEGDCEYIITGDRDLLDLKNYKKIKIVSAAEFLDELSQSHD